MDQWQGHQSQRGSTFHPAQRVYIPWGWRSQQSHFILGLGVTSGRMGQGCTVHLLPGGGNHPIRGLARPGQAGGPTRNTEPDCRGRRLRVSTVAFRVCVLNPPSWLVSPRPVLPPPLPNTFGPQSLGKVFMGTCVRDAQTAYTVTLLL